MTMDQFLTDMMELKSQKLLSMKDEKRILLETLQTLSLMTELFRDDIHDVVVSMGQRESLEWDADLKRFVYHRGETSQFLELARKDVLFRVGPYLKQLLREARKAIK